MPRPNEIAADARALYGPLDQRPSAQEAGDGALWIDPSAAHALYQVQSANWVQIGEGTAAPAAPAGVPVLYGPYVVDYTDFGPAPMEGAKVTLWVPALGDVLLRLFPDWQTVEQWDHGSLFVGQNVDGTVAPALNVITRGSPGAIGTTAGAGQMDTIMDSAVNGYPLDGTGTFRGSTAYVFGSTDPVEIQLAQTGGTDPGSGHVELFALIARPVTPS